MIDIRKLFLPKKQPIKRNFGFIETIPEPDDYRFGAAGAAKMILAQDRNYIPFLPTKENQAIDYETWACVTFSYLNAIEILLKILFAKDNNFSDRLHATVSGTVPGRGNSFKNVAEAGRKVGLVLEEEYPYSGNTVEEYYQNPPQSIIDKAKAFLQSYDLYYDWVGWGGVKPDAIYNALLYGPVQVSVDANATYTGQYSEATNHAVLVVNSEYKKKHWIFDHYPGGRGYLYDVPWNFFFGSAMQHSVIKKKYIPLVQVYGKAEIYAVIGTNACHIGNEDTWNYGVKIGIWEKYFEVLPQGTFDKYYTKGNQLIFK